VLLTGETQGYYEDFAEPGVLTKVLTSVFLHDGIYSGFRRRTHGRPVDRHKTPGWRFVVSLQTHDQVGNRATGDRLSVSLSPGLLGCGAALLLTGPCTPMLFMGEEWGASTPWQYFTDHTDRTIAAAVRRGRRDEFAAHGWDREDVPDPQSDRTAEQSKLRWDERSDDPHARLLAWYRELIALRRTRPDLRDPRLDRVLVEHDEGARTVVMHRGDHVVAVNLDSAEREVAVPSGLVPVLDWSGTSRVEGERLSLDGESAVVLGPPL
jgi:maltooligosyltrehalose trehalohydrolase